MKFTYFCLGMVLFASVACKRESEEIKVYKVSKEAASPSAAGPHAGGSGMGGTTAGTADPHSGVPGMGGMTAGGADPHAGVPGMGGGAPAMVVSDSPPAHWEKQAGAGMRLVSYLVKAGGDTGLVVSLSSLRAAPGSLLNAANLWREQFGLPVVDEPAVKQFPTTPTTFGNGVVVDIEGSHPADTTATISRLIGVIAEGGGNAFYFKMIGDPALVAKERENFIQWVASAKASPPATAAAPEAAAETGQTAENAPSPAPAGDGALTWTVPAGWIQAPEGGMGGYASFSITAADGGEAKMAVTHFPGDVGGDLANVNRWHSQVGAAPVAQEQLAALVTVVSAGPKTLQVIDCSGPQVRCTAAWVRHGTETWFFKLTGPDALVGAEKSRFTAFLESVRFTRPE